MKNLAVVLLLANCVVATFVLAYPVLDSCKHCHNGQIERDHHRYQFIEIQHDISIYRTQDNEKIVFKNEDNTPKCVSAIIYGNTNDDIVEITPPNLLQPGSYTTGIIVPQDINLVKFYDNMLLEVINGDCDYYEAH